MSAGEGPSVSTWRSPKVALLWDLDIDYRSLPFVTLHSSPSKGPSLKVRPVGDHAWVVNGWQVWWCKIKKEAVESTLNSISEVLLQEGRGRQRRGGMMQMGVTGFDVMCAQETSKRRERDSRNLKTQTGIIPSDRALCAAAVDEVVVAESDPWWYDW